MKFADFISPKAIQPQLAAQDREGVIDELVTSLIDAGEIKASDKQNIIEATSSLLTGTLIEVRLR